MCTLGWWLQFLNDEVLADEWKENFRMSKQLFLVLCEKLRKYISSNITTKFQGQWNLFPKILNLLITFAKKAPSQILDWVENRLLGKGLKY